MKKSIISLILMILCVCFSPIVSSAEENKKAILFRGNEWGASFEEVKNSFPAIIKWYTPEQDSSYSIMDHMLGTHKKHYDGHVCFYVTAISSTLKDFKVAGYDVSYVQLRFAYVPAEDGLLINNSSRGALYYAKYRIDSRDAKSTRDDLIEKLNYLYGSVCEESYPPFSFTETYYTWYGADGTMVSLMINNGYSKPRIELSYGFLGADELLSAAHKALEYQEKLETKSNYDGL